MEVFRSVTVFCESTTLFFVDTKNDQWSPVYPVCNFFNVYRSSL